jgi:hypothetical protein
MSWWKLKLQWLNYCISFRALWCTMPGSVAFVTQRFGSWICFYLQVEMWRGSWEMQMWLTLCPSNSHISVLASQAFDLTTEAEIGFETPCFVWITKAWSKVRNPIFRNENGTDQNLTVSHLVKTFPSFYATLRFITVFTIALESDESVAQPGPLLYYDSF